MLPWPHESRGGVAAAASPPLSARRLGDLPVVAPDGLGGKARVADVCEVYLTPDRTRLAGMVVFRSANVLGGGELLYLPEARIALLTPREILVATVTAFSEVDPAWRAAQVCHQLEMLRAGSPLPRRGAEIDLQIDPLTRRVLACTCAGQPATLLPGVLGKDARPPESR